MEDHVEIVAYDPTWPRAFAEESARLKSALGPVVGDIEHVGSTAVTGLGAKPTIDLMVGVPRLSIDDAIVLKMRGLDYEYLGEYGLPGRYFFRRGMPPTHHVHWVRHGGDFWTKQIVFRNYLRAHPGRCKSYETMKRGLADRFADDRAAYTAGKTDFIVRLQERAWRWAGAGLVVFDLEATCEDGGQSLELMETIQIGAVRLGPDLMPAGEFSRFVRPLKSPRLSDFCRELTGIRQEDVDAALPFSQALAAFSAWLGSGLFRLASWSGYDIEQFKRDAARAGGGLPPALERHLDLQGLYASLKNEPTRPLAEALERDGLAWEGRSHDALQDARNAARIARLMLGLFTP